MAAIIHQNRPDIYYIWIGSGPLESDARALARELNLDSVMHFLGHRQDVSALLNSMDCFVLPSRWEGFPLVVLEALAADVPVVATDIPGTREAIEHGWNGWLAPAGDCGTMAKYVLDILENPERALSFREAGRKRIDEEFSPKHMFPALESVYLDVLASPS
jgi:glycosyltransferase involved in cell wall biosynthesis